MHSICLHNGFYCSILNMQTDTVTQHMKAPVHRGTFSQLLRDAHGRAEVALARGCRMKEKIKVQGVPTCIASKK